MNDIGFDLFQTETRGLALNVTMRDLQFTWCVYLAQCHVAHTMSDLKMMVANLFTDDNHGCSGFVVASSGIIEQNDYELRTYIELAAQSIWLTDDDMVRVYDVNGLFEFDDDVRFVFDAPEIRGRWGELAARLAYELREILGARETIAFYHMYHDDMPPHFHVMAFMR